MAGVNSTNQNQGVQQQQQRQLPQGTPTKRQKRPGDELTRSNINRMGGLSSGINAEQIISKIELVERRRVEPLQEQKVKTLTEMESFNIIGESLKNMHTTMESLASSRVWDGKVVESSNEDVVTATATSGAKPGKHTLMVDKLAMNHQMASQGYETQDAQVGTGKFDIVVGDAPTVSVVIDESNNTLEGLKSAIDFATDEVNATIIKTGNKAKPYQLVLTSLKTGSVGKLKLDIQMKGGITPNYDNSVEAPGPWKGVGEPLKDLGEGAIGTGASTSIVRVVGDYEGEEDLDFTFTAIQSGIVGESTQMQVRWKDSEDRTGVIKLDNLNYAPGEAMEFVDGLQLVFSAGEIVVGDSFNFSATAERSDLHWWMAAEDRESGFTQPTTWSRQQQTEYGAPVIGGTYTGEDDQTFTLRVIGNGQVGSTKGLAIEWRASEGDFGTLSVGEGYTPGSPLAMTDGVTVALKPGVLTAGQEATFDVEASELSSQWWKSDSERNIPSTIGEITNWQMPEDREDEVARMPDIPEDFVGPKISTTKPQVSGKYDNEEAKVYTFTALKDGAIGVTRELKLRWDDDKGNSGTMLVGEDYEIGAPVEFDSGLSMQFSSGRVYKGDEFSLRTRTSTIQPPQDAQIRFGATELGGGLVVTNSTNEMTEVIEGVRLNLVTVSEKPVTITIRGDTENAMELVKNFVAEFNDVAGLILELGKYDQAKELAGPLLGNRDATRIQNRLSELVIDPVAGLPKDMNMLMALGIKFNDKGLLILDEATLEKRVQEDFGLVSDLFRSRGVTDNTKVAFLGMTNDTAINTNGYPVNISRPATQGIYHSQPLPGSIVINKENNRFSLNVDGRESEEIELAPNTYSPRDYAKVLQDNITNDKAIGKAGVRVMLESDNTLKVISGRFGAQSKINFFPSPDRLKAGVGLTDGPGVGGVDVVGTINGLPAEGRGQLLKLPEKNGPASGLRVYAKINESLLNPQGAEANIVITKGVASRIYTYLDVLVNPLKGEMKQMATSLKNRVDMLDKQIERVEERIERKKERIRDKFTRMETKMAKLKSQQASMSSQMPAGKGLPGLPGL